MNVGISTQFNSYYDFNKPMVANSDMVVRVKLGTNIHFHSFPIMYDYEKHY